MGYLSKAPKINELNIRKGIIYGSILASFAVEDFSVSRLLEISMKDINKRYNHYREITKF